MRGMDRQQATMFSYLSPERRAPADHPLRTLRPMVDDALGKLSGLFDAMYAAEGRPPPRPRDHRRSAGVAAASDPRTATERDQVASSLVRAVKLTGFTRWRSNPAANARWRSSGRP